MQPSDYRKRFLVKHLQQWIPVEVMTLPILLPEEGTSLFQIPHTVNFPVDYTDEPENADPERFFLATGSLSSA